MDKTGNSSNNYQINMASTNEQEKIKTDQPKRKNTSQEDKENLHKSVQKNNSPKRQREPLQSTCNISDHYPKRKRAGETLVRIRDMGVKKKNCFHL